MSKFVVEVTKTVEFSQTIKVNVTKADVVEALGLKGEDRKEWRQHVHEYLENDPETLAAGEVTDESENDGAEYQVDSVEDA